MSWLSIESRIHALLSDAEKQAITDRAVQANPRWEGCHSDDVLEYLVQLDSDLPLTEPFFEAHPELAARLGAGYAIRAMIWSGAWETLPNNDNRATWLETMLNRAEPPDVRSWLCRSDEDKPHRCPACWTGAAVYDYENGRMRWWHAYTCPRCGQRFATRPFLRDYAGRRYGTHRIMKTWWWRYGGLRWFWRLGSKANLLTGYRVDWYQVWCTSRGGLPYARLAVRLWRFHAELWIQPRKSDMKEVTTDAQGEGEPG